MILRGRRGYALLRLGVFLLRFFLIEIVQGRREGGGPVQPGFRRHEADFARVHQVAVADGEQLSADAVGDWIWVGNREDSGAVRLNGYTRMDLALFYDLTKFLQLYTRIDNATDAQYQEANGFNMPFTSFTVGTKVKI